MTGAVTSTVTSTVTRTVTSTAPARPLVDVVVVTYQSAAEVGACLDSLRGQPRLGEIVVVDNGSTDATADVVRGRPGVRLVPTGSNLGFGRGANRGIAATSSAYVCVLNPDLVVGAAALAQLAACLDDRPDVAVAAPLVANPDGTVYPSARSFPRLGDALGHATVGLVRPGNRWTQRYQAPGDPEEPDWVSGTAMLLRRAAVESVGCFDEAYFMYVEDMDLCWRLRRAGWRIAKVAAAGVVHEQGRSSARHPLRSLVDHHRSAWRFVCRTTRGPSRALLPVYGMGLAVRLLVALSLQRR